jgi:photosystem II stability/assembly factor-like uncharacterized protein
MKSLSYYLIFFFSLFGIAAAQTNYDLHDVYFLNNNRGFITGTDGLILKTTDAGETWNKLAVPNPNDLFKISFNDSMKGIITDYKTTDGGDTWFSNPSPTHVEFYVNDSVGYAGAVVPYILKTTNGGTNWFEVNTEYNDELYLSGLYFYNENEGFALSDYAPRIFRTKNGGTDWQTYTFCDTCTTPRSNKDFVMFDDVTGIFGRTYPFFANSPGDTTIYFYPDIADIRKTTDSGYTWQVLPPLPADSKDLYFKDINNGWLCGDSGKVYKTTNGGVTWNSLAKPANIMLLAVYFTDDLNGFVVGKSNSIYKTTDGGMSWQLKVMNGFIPEEKSLISVLLGKNEKPPVETEGHGGGKFILNAGMDTLHYWIRINNLECPFTEAHFHYGASGVAGPVVKDITTSFLMEDSTSYFASGVWTKYDEEPLTPSLASELIAGNIYVNVYSTDRPTGEIRGQITQNKPVSLYANLDGSQEVPPVNTMGSGEGWFTLSGDGDSLQYNVTAYNLSGAVSAAHFHKAPFGVAGPVVKPITFLGDTLSAGWWTANDSIALTPQLVADLLGGYLYVNVHTPAHPAGEIRGQINKTEVLQTKYMTMWAARNDDDPEKFSRLNYYSLADGQPFENTEGDITGYNGQKNIVDMTMDVGGNIYLLNNTWTSMIYRVKPSEIDLDPSTSVYAKQMGRTRLFPDETYVGLTSIQFIKGKLYGFDNKTNKLYEVNPYNAYVKEIASIDAAELKVAGFALGADGNVYLLKNTDEHRSELWKFNSFPSTDISLVTEVPSLGTLKTLSAHPNGNLYASCAENLYEINLANKTVGVLKDHKINVSAMDFNFFTEEHTPAASTVGFTNLDGVTAVKGFTGVPEKYELAQNFPNPFNPNTTIKYALPEASFVKLVVYNALGEVVKTLVSDNRDAGYYETVFDAKELASGMYIYRIEAGSFISTAKMILLK